MTAFQLHEMGGLSAARRSPPSTPLCRCGTRRLWRETGFAHQRTQTTGACGPRSAVWPDQGPRDPFSPEVTRLRGCAGLLYPLCGRGGLAHSFRPSLFLQQTEESKCWGGGACPTAWGERTRQGKRNRDPESAAAEKPGRKGSRCS